MHQEMQQKSFQFIRKRGQNNVLSLHFKNLLKNVKLKLYTPQSENSIPLPAKSALSLPLPVFARLMILRKQRYRLPRHRSVFSPVATVP